MEHDPLSDLRLSIIWISVVLEIAIVSVHPYLNSTCRFGEILLSADKADTLYRAGSDIDFHVLFKLWDELNWMPI